jgi:microcystin-dependent protein
VSDPFLAEIRIFSCNYAPTGWAFCEGQLLPISQNTALFSLLGTYYGGDGKSTFALPNLKGSAAMHWGQAASGSQYYIGDTGGETRVLLSTLTVPPHTHALQASAHNATLDSPGPQNALARSTPSMIYKTPAGAAPVQPLAAGSINAAGAGVAHNNMMPFLTLNFCIAMRGVYPPRS